MVAFQEAPLEVNTELSVKTVRVNKLGEEFTTTLKCVVVRINNHTGLEVLVSDTRYFLNPIVPHNEFDRFRVGDRVELPYSEVLSVRGYLGRVVSIETLGDDQ